MFTKIKRVNLAIQQMHLLKLYPGSACTIKRSLLRWKGTLQPTSLSDAYRVALTYKLKESPHVRVLDPVLQKRDGMRAPHMYSEDRLCLFLPGAMEWTGEMILANTIVPWASEWLLHYEVWLACGEWRGGGVHPNPKRRRSGRTDAI